MTDMLTALRAPTPKDEIQWRIGNRNADKTRGMALAYIDARFVQKRLDEVCGPAGWQMRFPVAMEKMAICEVGIRVGEEWLWKSDGAGATDFEAIKGALSDAFKRAAAKWGIGIDLYEIDSPWVPLDPSGRYIQDGVNPFNYVGKGGPPPPPAPAAKAAPAGTGASDTRSFSSMVEQLTDKEGRTGKTYTVVTFADGTKVNCNVEKFLTALTEIQGMGVPAQVVLRKTPDGKFWNIVSVTKGKDAEDEEDFG